MGTQMKEKVLVCRFLHVRISSLTWDICDFAAPFLAWTIGEFYTSVKKNSKVKLPCLKNFAGQNNIKYLYRETEISRD
jgi:hypothetical protein